MEGDSQSELTLWEGIYKVSGLYILISNRNNNPLTYKEIQMINGKVYISNNEKRLVVEFTPEDLQLIERSNLTLRGLAKEVMYHYWDYCTFLSNGFSWLAEPGDWIQSDVDEMKTEIKEIIMSANCKMDEDNL